jgi:threonylcarbamoyladenosine tRNA methylthiotransferase MtaB
MSEPHILTFGCRLNAYESEVMRAHAAATASGVETVIINTCAVTAEAERQARQAIRKLRRERPDARIVVTGCAAQVHPEKFAAMAEVDQVLGNVDKMQPDAFQAPASDRPASDRIVVTDIMQVREVASHLVSGFEGRARAFVEVQQGCDHRCTFCIIPFGRGPNRSVPVARVVGQVRELVAQGFNEVVLTGVDITSYGGDLPERPGLGTLVRRLLAEVPELPRLRLSSLDPVGVDAVLLAAVAEEARLMPHFHLSVQAGDDMVLKRMKRRHSRDDVLRLAERLRDLRGDVALGADLIAGFPTEDDDMFRQSLDLVDEAGFSHLHVFPFSPRPGTPAARMPQVNGAVAKERAAVLRTRGEATMAAFLASRIGREAHVLVEGDGEGFCEHYLPVTVANGRPGELMTVRIGGVANGRLEGQRP